MSLVSVIMPFLDPDVRFFQEAIESVLAQSHPDWELILVDDGSGEAARDVAARMAKDYLSLQLPSNRPIGPTTPGDRHAISRLRP